MSQLERGEEGEGHECRGRKGEGKAALSVSIPFQYLSNILPS